MKYAIGIYDDHTVILNGLKILLESIEDFEVAFTAASKEDLVLNLIDSKIDLLIMDVVVPGVQGLEGFDEVIHLEPKIDILAYTSLSSPILISNLLSRGVKGFVNKRQSEQDLIDAIIKVKEGGLAIPDEFQFLIKKPTSDTEISERELDVLNLIAKEYTSSQIAAELFISENTVENHRKKLFKKLNVKNLAGLIIEASKQGYLS